MQNSYDQIAQQWHSNGRDEDYITRLLGRVDQILEGLPSGARVLDLGCGTGIPVAKYMTQSGFRVVGVDQSKAMLEIARVEVPDAELIHSNMVDLELTGKFAAAVAWDSIFHVERKYHSAIYRKLANSLERGARLLLSVGGSDSLEAGPGELKQEGFTSEMYGHTFFYSGFAPRVARELLESAGFDIESWDIDDPSSRGHIAAIARRV